MSSSRIIDRNVTIPVSHVGYGAALSIILLVLALVMALALQLAGREREDR